ncbi:25182_t:CDS:2 [Dentiscutata erythropus]|uniref:25182_t:CDS:1 n=1 Tax=Dentiscutata erythropus TaxID=1348616 RepID=A0A9N9NCL6_9GLOM|nr:25182_t:CDS:2 [Dentiscutata erythropus]
MVRIVKDAGERLERELVNYKITDIKHKIREQFSNIDIFTIQSIVVSIPFSLFQAVNMEDFIFTLLKFWIININESVRKSRKELYLIISNTSEYRQMLPNYITPLLLLYD